LSCAGRGGDPPSARIWFHTVVTHTHSGSDPRPLGAVSHSRMRPHPLRTRRQPVASTGPRTHTAAPTRKSPAGVCGPKRWGQRTRRHPAIERQTHGSSRGSQILEVLFDASSHETTIWLGASSCLVVASATFAMTEVNICVLFREEFARCDPLLSPIGRPTFPRAFFHLVASPSLSLRSLRLRCSDPARVPRPNARPAPSSLRSNSMAMTMTMSASQSEPNAENTRTQRRLPPNRRRRRWQRLPRTCTIRSHTLNTYFLLMRLIIRYLE
jgi:hypothetical protein